MVFKSYSILLQSFMIIYNNNNNKLYKAINLLAPVVWKYNWTLKLLQFFSNIPQFQIQWEIQIYSYLWFFQVSKASEDSYSKIFIQMTHSATSKTFSFYRILIIKSRSILIPFKESCEDTNKLLSILKIRFHIIARFHICIHLRFNQLIWHLQQNVMGILKLTF